MSVADSLPNVGEGPGLQVLFMNHAVSRSVTACKFAFTYST